MRRRIFVVLAGIVLLGFGYFAYVERVQIAAKIWHLRYGHVVYAAGFAVPVPDNWFVKTQEDENTAILIDTHANKNINGSVEYNIVMLNFISHFPGNVDYWKSARKKWLTDEGLQSVEETEIQATDQTISCLGGDIFHSAMQVPNTKIVSEECMSTGKLSLTFSGNRSGLQEFFTIISQIHRKQ